MFRKTFMSSVCICIMVVAALPVAPVHAQTIETKIVSSVTTSVFIQQLFGELNRLIANAQNSGDYLLARTGIEAKNTIDAWQKANQGLLDEAFEKIDKTSRENFKQAELLIKQVNTGVLNAMEGAQQITDLSAQTLEGLKIGGGETFVRRFLPRVVPPNAQETFRLRIIGVNLDKGEPQLRLSQGNAERKTLGPTEVEFTIPISEVAPHKTHLQIKTFPLVYHSDDSSWFFRFLGLSSPKEVTRDISLVVLPSQLATYDAVAYRRFDRRDTRVDSVNLGQAQGRNGRISKVAFPPDGWKWDLGTNNANGHNGLDECKNQVQRNELRFCLTQEGGEAGRCDGIDNNQISEHGVTVIYHFNEIRDIRRPGGSDGRVTCLFTGRMYKVVPRVETDQQLPSGILNWTQDVPIPLPSDTYNARVTLTTFDGRKRVIDSIGVDNFFAISKNDNSLTITPSIPKDVLN